MTAYGALCDIADIQQGDYVVIRAASSSVGIAAIQLCLLKGAIPIATTRKSDKKKTLRDAGAKHVIARRKSSSKVKENH